MERFKRLLPEIARMAPLSGDEAMNVWEAYDESDSIIAYAFTVIVPEVVPDIPDMEEMDKYQVDGVVDPNKYQMINLDISLHPEGPDEPWSMEITEHEFESQYIGLTVEEIDLSPDGKIDAVTDATLSSTWITDAIREKVGEIIDRSKSSP